MKRLKGVLGFALICAVAVGLLSLIFPRDGVDRAISFDPGILPDDLDAYLAEDEAKVADMTLTEGSARRIVWASAPGQKTPLAIIYVHGFSATAEEIRPVPDDVAAAVGANLYFMRLTGHGRDGAAMAKATAGDWVEDMAEAMAIGRRLGDRVVLIATSTGAPLAMIAASDPALAEGLAGIVMISPNFGLRSAAGVILDMPLARYWGPLVAGASRSFTPENPRHAAHWTTEYPTTALFPMAALVREGRNLNVTAITVPALFIYSPADQVIDPARIPPVVAAWGGPTQVEEITVGDGDDPYAHVIAGDILSPGQTAAVTGLILTWIEGNGL
jgi:alpha-beta hydrolase superfamily lysophospholipase